MKIRVLKTLVAAVIAITLALLSMPISFAATNGTAGDESYWYFDSATGTMTITGSGWIGKYWDEQHTYDAKDLTLLIKKVVIEEGITEINPRTFKNHTSLESIELPDSLERIGESAFEGCSSLSAIEIPDNGVKIEYYVFKGCTALSFIVLPDSAELKASLRDTALYSNPEFCENNAIYINDRLVETDYKKISGEFTVREGTRIIGNSAFADCQSLEKVTLPDSVTTIGEYAFSDCYALTQVNIPSGVTYIAKSAFSSCDSLSEIIIPEGVTKIESSAFYSEFTPSRVVNMPKSVKEIEEYAFDCVVDEVNYNGSKEEWESIAIEEDGNENLLNAKINFNSYGSDGSGNEEAPTGEEKDSSVNPVIIGIGVAVAVVAVAAVGFTIIKKKKS